MADSYQTALDDARREYLDLLEQRIQIENRINQLKKVIDGLSPMCEPGELDVAASESGFTNAIRQIFSFDTGGLTPTQVRDRLVHAGWDFGQSSNPMASVHSILKRLLERGEIIKVVTGKGATLYVENPLPPPAVKRLKVFNLDSASAEPVIEMFKGAGSAPGALAPSLTKKQVAEAYKRGLKELAGLTGKAREAKQKEILEELAVNRKAASKKK